MHAPDPAPAPETPGLPKPDLSNDRDESNGRYRGHRALLSSKRMPFGGDAYRRRRNGWTSNRR